VKELAAFASSDAGKTFARVERHWGRDPAAFVGDDVLAHNLRAAFLITLLPEDAETVEADDPVERAKRGGQAIRRAMSG
jgi:hypothetical protein